MTILVLIGTVFVIIWEMFHGMISLNLVLLLLLVICEWVQVEINVYISHRNYQVKRHSSPWFSAACAFAIAHRNHFFRLHQHNNSFKSKVKFRQASNLHTQFPNLHMLMKQKIPSFLTNLACGAFGELLIVFSRKVNLLYLPCSMAWRCFLLHLIKPNCFLRTFLWILRKTQVSLYLFSLLQRLWSCKIFL